MGNLSLPVQVTMTIPDFQTVMLPLLKHLADGKEHSNRELTEILADYFQLSEEEQNRLLPSGKQKLFTKSQAAHRQTQCLEAGRSKSPTQAFAFALCQGRF